PVRPPRAVTFLLAPCDLPSQHPGGVLTTLWSLPPPPPELEPDTGRPAARSIELDMATPLIAGLSVAAAAMSGRYMIRTWQAFRTRAAMPRVRRFYPGGFQGEMNRREAALILGVRERATMDKIKEAHKRVMVANHPDAGGSHYVASKINEAKDILMGKGKSGASVF
uniref:J domain-containing protein n=3 Tax=Setaria TaxID=4554 RepID=K4AJB8_SETIT